MARVADVTAVQQTAIGFTSGKLSLEGVLTTPATGDGPHPALVVCHDHPVLGGSMDSPVVAAICRAAADRGMASMRFNFRGVGGSESEFSNGEGEQRDLKAALNVMVHWPGNDRKQLGLVGYSFGASVILEGLRHCKAAKSLVLIAPPISSIESSRVRKDKRHKLFLVGEKDRIAASAELQRALDGVRAPVRFAQIPGADHSLRGHEQETAEAVVDFLSETLGEGR